MSTILQALQKSKFDQVGGPPPVTPKNNKILQWKIIISVALFVIIALLGTLVYLLLNPRSEPLFSAEKTVQVAQPVINNHLVKVNFETEPLPTPVPKPKKIASPVKIVSALPKVETRKTNDNPAKNTEPEEKSVDYKDTPSDLKKRFELALLLTEIDQEAAEDNEFTTEEGMNDGSNIHDMSSNFQDKVPLIRYDSHMYSSVVADRWIRINGETLKEGEFDSTGQLELIEIQPQRSIFRLERQSFSLESLSDWKGY